MANKKHNYRLDDEFVEKCVKALAFYDIIDDIPVMDGETKEDADSRLAAVFAEKKTEYQLLFINS